MIADLIDNTAMRIDFVDKLQSAGKERNALISTHWMYLTIKEPHPRHQRREAHDQVKNKGT